MTPLIERLADVMKDRHKGGHPLVLMLGAGASLGSSVPRLADLRRQLLKDIERDEDPAITEKRLNQVWRKLSMADRTAKLAPFLGQPPSSGYRQLAALIAAGYVDVVISFNLDALLERALAAINFTDCSPITRGEVFEEAMADLIDATTPRLKLLKLHADLSTDTLPFSNSLAGYGAELAALLTRLTSNDTVVFRLWLPQSLRDPGVQPPRWPCHVRQPCRCPSSAAADHEGTGVGAVGDQDHLRRVLPRAPRAAAARRRASRPDGKRSRSPPRATCWTGRRFE